MTVSNKRDKADFVVLVDHRGGKPFFLKENKVVVFDKDGDAVLSASSRSLGNAVKKACRAIGNP